MNVEQKFIKMLMNKGMFESQAKEVMLVAKPKINVLIEDYNITWESPSHQYPDVVFNVLFMDVENTALQWIEDNVPMAWYKPMFI